MGTPSLDRGARDPVRRTPMPFLESNFQLQGARRPAGPARTVQPELLDRLPADSAPALASRRDLRRLNRLLGSRRWFGRVLRDHHRAGEPVLELGAGDGHLARAIGAVTADFAGLDLGPRPPTWPQAARWFATPVAAFAGWRDYPILVANLFLHHFESAGLAELGAQLDPHTRVLIASEPLRARRTSVWFALGARLIGAHAVTRHDGRVSIAAGFRGDELAHALRLDPRRWHWTARETWLGCCRLVAVRRA